MIGTLGTPDRSDMTVEIDVVARRAAVSGCLDMRTAPLLVETVSALLRFGEGDIVLDLRSVTFLDAAGMSGFVQLDSRLRPTGHRLLIEAVPARLNRLLVLAGLGHLARTPAERGQGVGARADDYHRWSFADRTSLGVGRR